MNLIIKTDFGADISCDIVRTAEPTVYYKTNEDDMVWQDLPAKSVKYIQIVGHRPFN